MDSAPIQQTNRPHPPAFLGLLAAALVALVACATAPQTTEVWSRFDGQRAAENAWIEADFRQAEAYCRFEVRKATMAGNPEPFVNQEGNGPISRAGVNAMNAVGSAEPPGMFGDCMGSRGYYLKETRAVSQ